MSASSIVRASNKLAPFAALKGGRQHHNIFIPRESDAAPDADPYLWRKLVNHNAFPREVLLEAILAQIDADAEISATREQYEDTINVR